MTFFPILCWRNEFMPWNVRSRMYTCVDHEGAECHLDQIGSKRNCVLRWDAGKFLKVWEGCARMIVGSNWFQIFLAWIVKVILLRRSLCENCRPVAIKSFLCIFFSMVYILSVHLKLRNTPLEKISHVCCVCCLFRVIRYIYEVRIPIDTTSLLLFQAPGLTTCPTSFGWLVAVCTG